MAYWKGVSEDKKSVSIPEQKRKFEKGRLEAGREAGGRTVVHHLEDCGRKEKMRVSGGCSRYAMGK